MANMPLQETYVKGQKLVEGTKP